MNQSLKTCKIIPSLLQMKNVQNKTAKYSCLCGQVFLRKNQRQDGSYFKNARVHSTQSDQHRQKVVLETSTPVIDKLRLDKVLDKEGVEKKDWRDSIYPYIELGRWDKPIGKSV